MKEYKNKAHVNINCPSLEMTLQ